MSILSVGIDNISLGFPMGELENNIGFIDNDHQQYG
jgi:hypothetical protein